MTVDKSSLPDLSMYTVMIDRFLSGGMTAKEFSQAYLRAQKADRRLLGDPWWDILQDLFADADNYVAEPRLRDHPRDLDDDQLKHRACITRHRLRAQGIP